jgi:hypothetical protein
MGDSFYDKHGAQFIARYIEGAPPSLEKTAIQADIATHSTKDSAAPARPVVDSPKADPEKLRVSDKALWTVLRQAPR